VDHLLATLPWASAWNSQDSVQDWDPREGTQEQQESGASPEHLVFLPVFEDSLDRCLPVGGGVSPKGFRLSATGAWYDPAA